jgi:fructokinase
MSRHGLANLLETELYDALFFANKAASIVCSRQGAEPPTLREVERLKAPSPKAAVKAEKTTKAVKTAKTTKTTKAGKPVKSTNAVKAAKPAKSPGAKKPAPKGGVKGSAAAVKTAKKK